jgi:hypothetical protein
MTRVVENPRKLTAGHHDRRQDWCVPAGHRGRIGKICRIRNNPDSAIGRADLETPPWSQACVPSQRTSSAPIALPRKPPDPNKTP